MAAYIAFINSTVHIIMYSYYFLSSFHHETLQKAIRVVKPFITIIQLVQFVIIITHCTIAILPTCGASYFFDIQIFNFVLLTFLFGKFFVQSYLLSERKMYSIEAWGPLLRRCENEFSRINRKLFIHLMKLRAKLFSLRDFFFQIASKFLCQTFNCARRD